MNHSNSPLRLLRWLLLCTFFFWFPPSAEGIPQVANPAGPVQWHVGMNLRLYISPDTGKTPACPPNLAAADKNAGLLPIWSNSGKIVTTKPAAAGPRNSLSFRLVSGWLSDTAPFDSTSQTFIKASEPFATGGDCWHSGAGDIVEQKPCGSDRLFQFYIETKATTGNMHLMRNADVKHIKVDPKGALVAVNENVPANVCVYQASTGSLVSAPLQDFHVPASDITDLIGQKVPPSTQPTNEIALPGCNQAKYSNIDCLISRAYNALPSICATKPGNMICVLHLAPAFCFDVPARRFKKDASIEVEACIRAVSLGPCVANPSGGACASGLFAGIVQFVSGGGQPGKKLMARSGKYSLEKRAPKRLFEPENNLPALDQFWVGMLKSLINFAISVVDLLRNGLVYSMRQRCYSVTFKMKQDQKTIDKVREGCAAFFKEHEPLPQLPYQSEVEKAGAVFADIVQILFGIDDLILATQAEKWVASMEEIIKYFHEVPKGTGKILEADGKGGKVQIYNDYGDGKGVPYHTDQALEDVTKSNEHNAFNNCKVCVGSMVKRQGGAVTKLLCCQAIPPRQPEFNGAATTEEEATTAARYNSLINIDEAVPLAERRLGNMHPVAKGPELMRDFRDGLEQWRKYYIEQNPPPPVLSRGQKAFYDALEDQYRVLAKQPKLEEQYHEAMEQASIQMWGLNYAEVQVVNHWVATGVRNHDLLESAFLKMNPVKTWTIANQQMPADVLDMLVNAKPGLVSKGQPGIYTLRDIKRSSTVADIRPSNPEPIMLSASVGMNPAYMANTLPARYLILPESARYVASISGTAYHEVAFYERICGQFQLLGWQEVNEGLKGFNEGGRPPMFIFIFKEINSKPFTPRTELPGLPKIPKVPH